jgi:hypothetical protein
MSLNYLSQILASAQKNNGITPIKLERCANFVFVSYLQYGMAITRKIEVDDSNDYCGALINASDFNLWDDIDNLSKFPDHWFDSDDEIQYPAEWQQLKMARTSPNWDFYFTIDGGIFLQTIDSIANTVRHTENAKVFISGGANSKIATVSARSSTMETCCGFSAVSEIRYDCEFSLPVQLIDLLNEEDFKYIQIFLSCSDKAVHVQAKDLTVCISWDDSRYPSSSAFGDYYLPRTSMKVKELRAAVKKVAKISSITGESALEEPTANLVNFVACDIDKRKKLAGLIVEGIAGQHCFSKASVEDARTSVMVCGIQLLNAIKDYPKDQIISLVAVTNYRIPQLIIESNASFLRILGLEQESVSQSAELWGMIANQYFIPESDVCLHEQNEDYSTLEVTREEVSVLQERIPIDDRQAYLNAIKENWDISSEEEILQITLVDDCVNLHAALSELESQLMRICAFESDNDDLCDDKFAALAMLQSLRNELEKIVDKADKSDPDVYKTDIRTLENLTERSKWLGHRISQALTAQPALYRYMFYVS